MVHKGSRDFTERRTVLCSAGLLEFRVVREIENFSAQWQAQPLTYRKDAGHRAIQCDQARTCQYIASSVAESSRCRQGETRRIEPFRYRVPPARMLRRGWVLLTRRAVSLAQQDGIFALLR
jgi:hypothetical protein